MRLGAGPSIESVTTSFRIGRASPTGCPDGSRNRVEMPLTWTLGGIWQNGQRGRGTLCTEQDEGGSSQASQLAEKPNADRSRVQEAHSLCAH